MDYHQTMIESEYFDDQNKHARGAQTVWRGSIGTGS
jgi:hypothetical protein